MEFENWFGIVVGVFIVIFLAGMIYLARLDEKSKPEVVGPLYAGNCLHPDVDGVGILMGEVDEVVYKGDVVVRGGKYSPSA